MFLFGRAVWLRHGDPFALAFGVFARFAPTGVRVTDPAVCARCPTPAGTRRCVRGLSASVSPAPPAARELNLRPYGAGLLRRRGRVPLDGRVRATAALDRHVRRLHSDAGLGRLYTTLYGALALLGAARLTAIGTLGLLRSPRSSGRSTGCSRAGWRAPAAAVVGRHLARLFVLSLVPIAIAYHLAHYLTYLLIQGQLVIRLASDPFGFGWDLLARRASVPISASWARASPGMPR